VSTRVLPEPAGAITRAGPLWWPTAASWSAASSADGPTGSGATANRPSSTLSWWITAWPLTSPGAHGRRGPPSIHAERPSARVTSAGPWGVSVAPERAALRPHHQIRSPSRASYALFQTRKWRRSNHGSASGLNVHGAAVIDAGWRNRAGSTASSTTTGSRRAQVRCNRSTVSAGAFSTASSTHTTDAAIHGAGMASPTLMTTLRPSTTGPGTPTPPTYAGGVTAKPAASLISCRSGPPLSGGRRRGRSERPRADRPGTNDAPPPPPLPP
jgi:hypothetical protein